jgi:hypothetical protein
MVVVSDCDEASDDMDGASCEHVLTMVRDLANKFEHLVTDGKNTFKALSMQREDKESWNRRRNDHLVHDVDSVTVALVDNTSANY